MVCGQVFEELHTLLHSTESRLSRMTLFSFQICLLPHRPSTFFRSWQAGKGSATLSMAYAAAKFAESCLSALAGVPGVVECAYVDSHLTELPFFASPVRLGPSGVEVTPAPPHPHNFTPLKEGISV